MMRAFALIGFVLLAGCERIPGTDAHAEAAAKKLISEQMRDPQSTQFRNLRVVGTAVCGEINAKNAMGGYVGFTPFMSDAGDGTWAIAQEQTVTQEQVRSSQESCAQFGESLCDMAWKLAKDFRDQQEAAAQVEKKCGTSAAA